MSNLHLIIESTALVAQSARIKVVQPTSGTIVSTNILGDSSSPNNNNNTQNANVELMITHGNVFHPQSNLTIVLPVSTTTTSNFDGGDGSTMYKISIGENNLFEEECNVILDLKSHYPTKEEEGEEAATAKESLTLIGSYNLFTPKSHVQVHTIGNGNIFHPFCNLISSTSVFTPTNMNMKKRRHVVIGNGNMFNSFVTIHSTTQQENGINNDSDDGDMSLECIYQNQVYFTISSASASVLTSTMEGGGTDDYPNNNDEQSLLLMQRKHHNGVRKNMNEVRLLLNAAKRMKEYHHMMSSTTISY
mmetsp:Transcript_15119/g.18428  ORF Transcript_15119/g.18428 Transcript_15119/m.18428 type:complete len:304 (-) Transcript_15119:81-992(-)